VILSLKAKPNQLIDIAGSFEITLVVEAGFESAHFWISS
jgi:hypothetical protein